MRTMEQLCVLVHEWISNRNEDLLQQLGKVEGAAKLPELRALLTEHQTAFEEQMIALMEETLMEYKRENCHLRMLLDAVLKPQVRLKRADIQQLLLSKEDTDPEQQAWSSHVDQEDPEAPHIKVEQEELWTSQEGEQLHGLGLGEADIPSVPVTPVLVKSEDDEEKPQFSQLHQIQTEENREEEPQTRSSTHHMSTEADSGECGGSESASNTDPDTLLLLLTGDNKMSDSSKPVTEDSEDDWMKPISTFASVSEKPYSSSLLLITKVSTGDKTACCSINNLEVNIENGSEHFENDTFVFSVPETEVSDDLICSTCGKSYTSKRNLKTHMRTHTGEKPFPCSICCKRFSQKVHLKRHMRKHTGEKPFPCSVCGVKFSSKQSMQTHIRTHTGEKPFPCSVCGERFAQNEYVKIHMRTHTGEKPFPCSVCGERFSQKGTFQRHMRTHTGEKPFPCSICGDRFSLKQSLQVHMRTHTGEKPFPCSVCCVRFSDKGHLKTHMKKHSGEKPFPCSVCGERFSQKGTMQRHMRTHNGEKPFPCSICGERFSQKGTIRRHMRIHTGEKPFSCSICGERFSLKQNLKTHMRTHTGEKPFSCSVCGERFSLKQNMKRHENTHW